MSKGKQHPFRSTCPINYTLEIVGDKWSLLIIRDMLFADKKTFGEFLQSEEKIARNILSSRLKMLESQDILRRQPHPTDGRKDIFVLTSKGRGFIPLILQAADWGIKNYPNADHFAGLGKPPYTNRRSIEKLRLIADKDN